MSFRIIRDDITRVSADAIVNTANPDPVYGNGTDRAIYEAAGVDSLLRARQKIGRIEPGQAFATEAFELQAKYILHTVGPAWIDGRHGEYEQLASCYRESLKLASLLDCVSVAFPLISTGTYGFPKSDALQVALDTIAAFQEHDDREMDVTLVVFNREAFEISSSLRDDIDEFIDENYVREKHQVEHAERPDYRKPAQTGSFSNKGRQYRRPKDSIQQSAYSIIEQESLISEGYHQETDSLSEEISSLITESISQDPSVPDDLITDLPAPVPQSRPDPPEHSNRLLDSLNRIREILPFGKPSQDDLDNALLHPGESFQQMLLRLIDERNMTDPQVYKKANIDRKLFSKIRCTPDYRPSKKTVLALAIALELNLSETAELLSRAEMAFSPAKRADLIIEYCIENEIYNIYEINALLFEYDQPLLC